MPNETMIRLGLLSKKSPQTVEKMYNDLMVQMKKSGIGNNEYKKYQIEANKTPPNTNNVSKLYGEFMKVFNQELKKKLGINKDIQTEAEELDEEGEGIMTTTSVGSPTTVDGKAAPFGNSSIYAPKIGGGMQKRTKPDLITFGKKKVKKESEEFLDKYFSNLS